MPKAPSCGGATARSGRGARSRARRAPEVGLRHVLHLRADAGSGGGVSAGSSHVAAAGLRLPGPAAPPRALYSRPLDVVCVTHMAEGPAAAMAAGIKRGLRTGKGKELFGLAEYAFPAPQRAASGAMTACVYKNAAASAARPPVGARRPKGCAARTITRRRRRRPAAAPAATGARRRAWRRPPRATTGAARKTPPTPPPPRT